MLKKICVFLIVLFVACSSQQGYYDYESGLGKDLDINLSQLITSTVPKQTIEINIQSFIAVYLELEPLQVSVNVNKFESTAKINICFDTDEFYDEETEDKILNMVNAINDNEFPISLLNNAHVTNVEDSGPCNLNKVDFGENYDLPSLSEFGYDLSSILDIFSYSELPTSFINHYLYFTSDFEDKIESIFISIINEYWDISTSQIISLYNDLSVTAILNDPSFDINNYNKSSFDIYEFIDDKLNGGSGSDSDSTDDIIGMVIIGVVSAIAIIIGLGVAASIVGFIIYKKKMAGSPNDDGYSAVTLN
eukprot:TRINITY_DN14439_c0_g1_i1.p1 TRINITY_DN14439_c0_g1~~TRINITY_DN14439_c0_g1_i1.p1  ORF type:complete len:306 (-),score=87.17 TRINITY_DN14439_c0_g1_i1:220-1137(-)